MRGVFLGTPFQRKHNGDQRHDIEQDGEDDGYEDGHVEWSTVHHTPVTKEMKKEMLKYCNCESAANQMVSYRSFTSAIH